LKRLSTVEDLPEGNEWVCSASCVSLYMRLTCLFAGQYLTGWRTTDIGERRIHWSYNLVGLQRMQGHCQDSWSRFVILKPIVCGKERVQQLHGRSSKQV
jgi:hypothetical protein